MRMTDKPSLYKKLSFPSHLGEAIQFTRAALQQYGVESAELDARLLMLGASGQTLNTLIANPYFFLNEDVQCRAEAWLMRRLQGEPVARILGEKEFWGLPFGLNHDTLVPRPDTETLIEVALELFPTPPQRILDLGTGTGCILLALLHEWKTSLGIGIDISALALEQARKNAELLGLDKRAAFIHSDWESALPEGQFDLVISNPPYIPSHDIHGLSPEVRLYDPPKALDGGADGLDDYFKIASIAQRRVVPDGWLILELGVGQQAEVSALLWQNGFSNVQMKRDLAGIARALYASR